MKRILLFQLFLFSTVVSVAQSEITTPFFDNVFQATYLDPTVRPEHLVSIGLPGLSSVYVQVIHNGFIPKNVISRNQDTLRINPNDLHGQLSRQNMFHTNADVDIFHFRIKVYNWDYWLGIRQRHSVSFFYPKDLFTLAIEGNADLVGQSLDLGNLGLNAHIYREYTLGASTKWDYNWVFGARLSYLQGLSSMYLKPERLRIKVLDDMYTHSFASDAVFYTAGVPFDDDWMIDSDLLSDSDWLNDYFRRFRNPGFALAAGASYQLDHQFSFHASISDIGFIRWNDSTQNFRLTGEAEFWGADVIDDRLNDIDTDLDVIWDDLREQFADEEFEGAYTTWLAPKLYISANYDLLPKTRFNFQFYSTLNRRFYPAVSIGATQGFGRYFQLALNASANQRSFTNFGLGLMVKPGPLQIFVMADNYYAPLFEPLNFTNLNFRFGINLVFGRVKTEQGLPYR